MAITTRTRKILWAKSKNQCAICKIPIVVEKDQFNNTLIIGEECHIISKNKGGPRYKAIQDFDYDSEENLLLLCRNHHIEVDTMDDAYPIERLQKIKKEHEITEKVESSKQEEENEETNIIDLTAQTVKTIHDKEMNLKSSRDIYESEEGIQIAHREVKEIKDIILDSYQKIQEKAPNFNIRARENKENLLDIIFKKKTLLAQFYQPYINSAVESYLLFAIVDGLFRDDGTADPFYRPSLRKIIRLDFAFDSNGIFGWRDQVNKELFYTSKDITEKWIDKFFKYTLEK